MLPKRRKDRLTPVAEALIKAFGYTSAVVVVLIIIFLFREGLGLFTSQPLAEDLVVAVPASNPVRTLSGPQLADLHNTPDMNWAAVGGPDAKVVLINIDNFDKKIKTRKFKADNIDHDLPLALDSVARALPGVLFVFPERFLKNVPGLVRVDVGSITVGSFLFGPNWQPTRSPVPEFGAVSLLAGTFLVTFLSILIALPLGLAVAFYLSELADDRLRNILKPMIELLAGIPSVVYGFFGLVVLVPLIQQIFDIDTGKSALAGAILLAVIALPTIITLSEDALKSTPRALKEASLALGATHWQTITKVVVPYAFSGIAAATILGIGRAFGETMTVLMVTGNSAFLPDSILSPVRTLSATIAAELGEAPQGGVHYKALFVVGIVLFLITFAFNMLADYIGRKSRIKA